MEQNRCIIRQAGVVMALSFVLTLLPVAIPGIPGMPKIGAVPGCGGGALLAADEAPYRTYTFAEVGAIAQNNSNEIIRQKATVIQAENAKESQFSNFQSQVFEFYSNPDTNISEDSLYSLQESYENAFNNYLDAEESLEKLKPKVSYQAQKLYIDILLGEMQIQIQEMEVQRLENEHELAKVKTAFGVFTQTQLRNAATQLDRARETLDSLENTRNTNRNTMREYLNLADSVEFGLENPPVIGPYTQTFEEEEVLAEALKNSLALKQAQREVEDLTKRIERYEINGQFTQAQNLAVTGPSKDQALKETKQSLVRTVETVMKEFKGLDAALDKAKESLYDAQRTLISTSMKQKMGVATINEWKLAEKAVFTAEMDLFQAQHNCYLSAKKVILLNDGILVS